MGFNISAKTTVSESDILVLDTKLLTTFQLICEFSKFFDLGFGHARGGYVQLVWRGESEKQGWVESYVTMQEVLEGLPLTPKLQEQYISNEKTTERTERINKNVTIQILHQRQPFTTKRRKSHDFWDTFLARSTTLPKKVSHKSHDFQHERVRTRHILQCEATKEHTNLTSCVTIPTVHQHPRNHVK